MQEIAKTLIIFGIILIIAGLLLTLFKGTPNLGRLPGDIYIEKKNFSFYFPLAACALISIICNSSAIKRLSFPPPFSRG
ncbi:MAG: DUF2905 domain-containing protein [Candidatus Omnitrophota bacterium]|nr:DUF2905 domain-containing protein [Candidatus Omnitrophota bacterium]